MIIKIKKRDGRTVTFNIEKIANAIYKAAQSVGGSDQEEALVLSGKVVDMLMEKNLTAPTVEQIQDCVEKVLINEGHAATAKAYILYRSERTAPSWILSSASRKNRNSPSAIPIPLFLEYPAP